MISPQMKNNANLVREFIDDVLNRGNVESTGKYFHEDVLEQARFVWSGTHRGEFLGAVATGRSVSVWGIAIDRFVDGKIKDTRIIMDALGLMAQMGVLPSPKQVET